MSRPIRNQRSRKGGSLVEFALTFPLIFVLIVNAVNFGTFLYASITVANAARTGAQYLVLGPASVGTGAGNLSFANSSAIQALVASDISSLPNQASLVVQVCTNNGGVFKKTEVPGDTGSCTTGGFSDPEATTPALYVLGTVDVTYCYNPPIPLWNFSKLGITATLLKPGTAPCTAAQTNIHRKAVMRMIQ
jgi:Flp pilus assembly protein TadG